MPVEPKKETDLAAFIDEAIKALVTRNEKTQEAKTSGSWWKWLLAVEGALIALIGIGILWYYFNRRSQELAEARTELEHQKIDAEQQRHVALQEQQQQKRAAIIASVVIKESQLKKDEVELAQLEQEHAQRKIKLESLKSWGDINKQ